MRALIALVIWAALCAPRIAWADDAAAQRAQTASLLARRRFFDAHVSCMIGRRLAAGDDARVWYQVRDGYSLWMLGDRSAGLDALLPDDGTSGAHRDLLALTAAWLELYGGNQAPLAAWAEGPPPSELKRRGKVLLDVSLDRSPPAGAPIEPLVRRFRDRKRVPPAAVAVASAFVPGAGHAALGLWGDAAVAFTLNAVSIGATVELARSRPIFPSVAAGLVASLFYVGAIVSASTLASERNERERQEKLSAVGAALFPELPVDPN